MVREKIPRKVGCVTMEKFKTEQEKFWSGEFGDDYVERNNGKDMVASDIALFSKILGSCEMPIESVIEFGPNVGMNLKALKALKPNIKCAGVEINEKAANILKNDPFFSNDLTVYNTSILDYDCNAGGKFDVSLIKGVCIHINPDELQSVYQKLYDSSNKYIIICEYYNPTPVEVVYRGNTGKLFKRDFAGEFMDKFSDVSLVDYGFVYHRDNNFPMDDATWFLLRKNG